jgi:hypothetical protein
MTNDESNPKDAFHRVPVVSLVGVLVSLISDAVKRVLTCGDE